MESAEENSNNNISQSPVFSVEQEKDSQNLVKERYLGLDILRCIALLLVFSVHFFLNTDYYNLHIVSVGVFAATLIRTVLNACIPLWLIISGYLVSTSKYNKKYYKRCFRILFEYLVVSVLCIIFDVYVAGRTYTAAQAILALVTFSACGYAWYVNMYLGLFLIMPFLNYCYHAIDSKNKKMILIISLATVCALPNIINFFTEILHYDDKITNYWHALYPFLYYFIGAYIREYKPMANWLVVLAALICTTFIATGIIFVNNPDKVFVNRLTAYEDIFTIMISTLIFLLFYRVGKVNDLEQKPKRYKIQAKKFFKAISDATFSAYLLSACTDFLTYGYINNKFASFGEKFMWFPVVIIFTFVVTIGGGYIINILYKGLEKGIQRLIKKIKGKAQKTMPSEPPTLN